MLQHLSCLIGWPLCLQSRQGTQYMLNCTALSSLYSAWLLSCAFLRAAALVADLEHSAACRADKAREYERKLEYLRREEELIREEEMEAEALLQSDRPTLHTDQTAPEVGWSLPDVGSHADGLCRRLRGA